MPASGNDPLAPSVGRLNATEAYAAGVVPAKEVCPAVSGRRYLHAGPPLPIGEMAVPMRAALIGALLFEGEVNSVAEAEDLIEAGGLEVISGPDVGCAGGMTGVVSPSMPVVVARTRYGLSFSPIHEGAGPSLRFGANGDDVVRRLTYLREKACPLLDRALKNIGELSITDLQIEGLRRGDECHNRSMATTSAFFARVAPHLFRVARHHDDPADVLEHLTSNTQFFGAFCIAGSKAVANAAHGVTGSPIVTSIAANGRELGIQVSGTGNRWFSAPAPLSSGRLLQGFRPDDAVPAMGDSFVAEVVGLGAFALSAAPAAWPTLAVSFEDALGIVREMRSICAGLSDRFLLPVEDFLGTPIGIDVRKVVERNVSPIVAVGVAHKRGGHGAIGAGLARLPLEPFASANAALQAADDRSRTA